MGDADSQFANRLYLNHSYPAERTYSEPRPSTRSSLLSSSKVEKLFANVIVDIQSTELKDKLFTYEIPDHLVPDAFIGAHVLVPFGHNKTVGGLILSLSDTGNDQLKNIKQIADVVEAEPLFDRDYVEFLYWVADYYCARVADVISAAIPSNFSPRLKKTVSLTEPVHISDGLNRTSDPLAREILTGLQNSKSKTLSLSTIKQNCKRIPQFTSASFYRSLNHLRVEGIIKTGDERMAAAAPKMIPMVIWTGQEPANSRQANIINTLKKHNGQMRLRDLITAAATTQGTIKKLIAAGLLESFSSEQIRDPLAQFNGHRGVHESPFTLTDEQSAALVILSQAQDECFDRHAKQLTGQLQAPSAFYETDQAPMAANGSDLSMLKIKLGQGVNFQDPDNRPWLLHGVTGSGKTEIYLRLIERTLKLKRTAIFLVPEISLTPQSARRLTDRFGDKVAIWHSSLTTGEKYDTWRRLRMGDVQVLLGARSAILSAMPNLGLIILDEEHDSSYKQTSPSPRYSAKELAIERARRTGSLVVFGSATPDLVAYKAAKDRGQYVVLTNRVHKQAMPKVQIVDMRQEFQSGNRSIFSRLLLDHLAATLKKDEQAILLMNRRGFASHVFCRACGYIARCKNCSVSLVFHQSNTKGASAREDYALGHLACHHCGYQCGSIFDCPTCRSPFIRQMGLGTQKVEMEIREIFPSAKVLRLDSDIALRKGSHDEILEEFSQGKADILIGTQMVAKGLDIANVTLVGVVAADAAFNMPDYRSTERGFQLLTQVSGRTGRGDKAGAVVWQTYNTEMPVLSWAKTHDFQLFAEEELKARESFNYPPFSQLIRIVVAGGSVEEVERACDLLAEEIGNFLADEFSASALHILGPAPCLLERLRGRFRYHLLIKNFEGNIGQKAITNFLRNRKMPEGVVMAVDVDALDLM